MPSTFKLFIKLATSVIVLYLCWANIENRREIAALRDELRLVRRMASDAWILTFHSAAGLTNTTPAATIWPNTITTPRTM
jgi:hypothetical protein